METTKAYKAMIKGWDGRDYRLSVEADWAVLVVADDRGYMVAWEGDRSDVKHLVECVTDKAKYDEARRQHGF